MFLGRTFIKIYLSWLDTRKIGFKLSILHQDDRMCEIVMSCFEQKSTWKFSWNITYTFCLYQVDLNTKKTGIPDYGSDSLVHLVVVTVGMSLPFCSQVFPLLWHQYLLLGWFVWISHFVGTIWIYSSCNVDVYVLWLRVLLSIIS